MNRRQPSPLVRRLVLALAAIVILLAGYILGNQYARQRLEQQVSAQLLDTPRLLPTLSLTGTDGQPFGPEAFRAHWARRHHNLGRLEALARHAATLRVETRLRPPLPEAGPTLLFPPIKLPGDDKGCSWRVGAAKMFDASLDPKEQVEPTAKLVFDRTAWVDKVKKIEASDPAKKKKYQERYMKNILQFVAALTKVQKDCKGNKKVEAVLRLMN